MLCACLCVCMCVCECALTYASEGVVPEQRPTVTGKKQELDFASTHKEVQRKRRRSVANDLAEYAKCFLFIYANINSFLLPAPMPQSSLQEPPEGSNCTGWARLRKPGTSHRGACQHLRPGFAN